MALGIAAFLLMQRKGKSATQENGFVSVSNWQSERTIISYRDLYNSLIRHDLSHKCALLALAQAIVECWNADGNLHTCAFNFWNFGEPSSSWYMEWKNRYGLSKCPRADEMGFSVSFPNLDIAIDTWLEVLKHRAPEGKAYYELMKSEPDENAYVDYICNPYHWAGACEGNEYQTAILNRYNELLEHGL